MPIVTLTGIKFNHDTSSFTNDALNIRKNFGTPVNIPEWQRGVSSEHEHSPAAYAIRETKGKTLTIQAAFEVSHPEDIQILEIRAIDPIYGPPIPKWLWFLILILLILLRLPIPFNILGRVKERTVKFKQDGTSDYETFELTNSLLWGISFLGLTKGTVGKYDITWRWQYRHSSTGPWNDFEHSRHRIYVVLEEPKAPWTQNVASPQNWPWTDALDHTCGWAVGTSDLNEAATAVTRCINAHPLQSYTPITLFVKLVDDPVVENLKIQFYLLSSYINALNDTDRFSLNCTDCANAVTTFSNILGCNLWEGRFDSMKTRRFLKLNGNPDKDEDWVSWDWLYHEICWLDQMGQYEYIYDGCLQLDMDNNYADDVHIAKLPTKMRFGLNDPNDYRYRLVDVGSATLSPPAQRRPIM
jgi:hypothetical protein